MQFEPGLTEEVFRRVEARVFQVIPAERFEGISSDHSFDCVGATSLDIVCIISAIETEFDITFPAHMVALERFSSMSNVFDSVIECLR